MKITNKQFERGLNGTKSTDFDDLELKELYVTNYRDLRGSCGGLPAGFVFEDEFLQNRTHEKSEKDAYDRESDPTSASP